MNITIQIIDNLAKVRRFFKELLNEGTAFHPDTDFNDIHTYQDGKDLGRTYTPKESVLLNRMMRQAFKVCKKRNADIYGIACDVTYAHPDYQFLNDK